jgi:hypothetical protein
MSCKQLEINSFPVIINPQTGMCGGWNGAPWGESQCVPMQ